MQEKVESVRRLVALGLSLEQISQGLDLDIERVRQEIAQE
jgi:predicted transposase YdaD